MCIESHFEELYTAYKNVDSKVKKEEIIAVITLFKAQSKEIKKQLCKTCDSQTVPVDVGRAQNEKLLFFQLLMVQMKLVLSLIAVQI